MKKSIGTLFLALSFLFLTNAAFAQCGDKAVGTAKDCNSETSKIALVKFSADYCGACQKLDPKITELKTKLSQDVVYVKFDFTSDDSKAKTSTLAKEQGLASLLESNSGTGYLVVYDLKNKKVLATLNNSQSVAEMEKAVKSYL